MGGAAENLLSPMFIGDTLDAWRADNWKMAAVVAPLSWAGVPTVTYKPRADSTDYYPLGGPL